MSTGRKTNIPSFLVKQGGVIKHPEKSREIEVLRSGMQRHDQRQISEWVHVGTENMRGVVQALPKRDDITLSFQEQLVVELYSK